MKSHILSVVLVACAAVSAAASGVTNGWSTITRDSAAVARCIHQMGTTPAAELVAPGRVRLPITYSRIKGDRASWDISVQPGEHLTDGLEFDLVLTNSQSIAACSIYAHSGKGWYSGKFTLPSEGIGRVTVLPEDFDKSEGTPEGWNKVDLIRLSFWRTHDEHEVDCEAVIGDFHPLSATPDVIVVGGDSCAKRQSGEDFTGFASRMTTRIRLLGLQVRQISDSDLTDEVPSSVKVIVLPYNTSVPDAGLKVLEKFVSRGGKLFACYSLPKGVAKLLGVKYKSSFSIAKERSLPSPAGIGSTDCALALQPKFAPQASPRTGIVELTDKSTQRVIGVWVDSQHRPIAGLPPALVYTPSGIYLAHVWLGHGADSQALARSIFAALSPSCKGKMEGAVRRAAIQRKRDEEYVRKMDSKPGEWRAFWCHSEKGLGGDYSWDDSIRILKENGFNAILPNLAWAGTLFPMEECLAACRKHGVACHVWKVCWRGKAGREVHFPGDTQVQFDGKPNAKGVWMCPSDPRNLAAEVEDFMTIARMKPAGVHFDYIRYPNADTCFCDGCRRRFEKRIGRAVAKWPADVRKDEALKAAWKEFRCDNVSALVREVSRRVRAECPGVQVSAAVFSNVRSCDRGVGQAWAKWCKEGLLDFACPMDYYMGTTSAFAALVKLQIESCAGGAAKIRPGLGLSCWKSRDRDAYNMAQQIGVVRSLGLDGFTVFNYDSRALLVLPVLHTGPTK